MLAGAIVPPRTLDPVTLSDLTRTAVLAAIDEFDRVGREEFLRSAGFSHARSYYVTHDGRLYDAKAIAGYAQGASTGTALRSGDITLREATVADTLRSLGFEVKYLPNPDWTRDEVILACALVESNAWRQLDRTDARVKELSDLLQTPAIFPPDQRGPDFRNCAGVARKTADIATRHPSYRGKPTNGSRLDREVLDDFLARAVEMRSIAAAIRAAMADDQQGRTYMVDPDLDELAVEEGGVLLRQHLRRERDTKIRDAALELE